jgi:hypothetical protein
MGMTPATLPTRHTLKGTERQKAKWREENRAIFYD